MTDHGHGVSFYDNERDAVAEVTGYVIEGLCLQEPVLVVATAEHLAALDASLVELGHDPVAERDSGRLVTRDAAETLRAFMVGDSPDPTAFRETIGTLLDRVRGDAPTVRVFGEMVSVLWDEGNVTAALDLESCWNDLAADHPFNLLCAYPHTVLDEASLADVGRVCALHTAILPPSSYLTDGQAHDPLLDQRGWAFLPVPKAIPVLRRFVSDTLAAWGEDRLVEDAVLVTSELATNAINHAVSPFHAQVTRAAGVVRIAISDVGPGTAAPRVASDGDVSGRGIVIIDALADRWGIDARAGTKVVWAEFSA